MLGILSILGVAQSMVLSIFFFRKRGLSVQNNHLSGLFLLLAMAMLLISLSEAFVPKPSHLLEIFEFSLTLSAGPVLYIMATNLLRKNISRLHIFIHFVTAIVFLIVSLADVACVANVWKFLVISAMIPVIPMQMYTLWLCWIIITRYQNGASELTKEFKWLVMISGLLVTIHFAQWIRFIYSGVDWLKLIVPATAFVSVYTLTFYGFLESGLFFKRFQTKTPFLKKMKSRNKQKH